MNQRGFSPILIVLGIVVMTAVVGGAYYLGQNNLSLQGVPSKTNDVAISPTPSPSANPDSIGNDWKTYSNTKLKFSFRYPKDYKFEKEDNEKVTFSGTFQPGDQVTPSELVVYFQPTLDLNTLKNCKDADLQDNVITTCSEGGTVKDVNGVQMNVFSIRTGSKNSQAAFSYVYQTINNPRIEFINKVYGGGVELRVDQILSTFRFD